MHIPHPHWQPHHKAVAGTVISYGVFKATDASLDLAWEHLFLGAHDWIMAHGWWPVSMVGVLGAVAYSVWSKAKENDHAK